MLNKIALSVSLLSVSGAAFGADVLCNSVNNGLSGIAPYSYNISANSIAVFKDSRLQSTVELKPVGQDFFLGGRKIYMYARGEIINSKIYLYSNYIDNKTVSAGVMLKHDRVDTFETNCEF